METKRQKTIRLLDRAGIEKPETTAKMSDAELLLLKGVGKKSLPTIRRFWPIGGNEKPDAVPVYQFGLKGSSEKSKRRGIWFNMAKIAPELWGGLWLRICSLTAAPVMAAADRAMAEVMASSPGREVALGKIREEVNADRGDQALSAAVMAASFTMLNRPTRTQQLEIEWRRLLAAVRGIRGEAAFSTNPEDVTVLTGDEPAEEVQALISDVVEVSSEHQQSIMVLVNSLTRLDDSEIIRLGEAYVVTELPSANSPDSGTTNRSAGSK